MRQWFMESSYFMLCARRHGCSCTSLGGEQSRKALLLDPRHGANGGNKSFGIIEVAAEELVLLGDFNTA